MRGIYKIKSKKTNMVYIGESMNIERRWEEHAEMLNNSNHHSKKLQRAWNKEGGISAFEFVVLEEIDIRISDFISIYYLVILEDTYIKKYDSVNRGFNCEYTLEKVLKGERNVTYNNKDNKDMRMIKTVMNRLKKGIKLYKVENEKNEKRLEAKNIKVICIETGIIYNNAKEATEKCYIYGNGSITYVCRRGGGKVKLKNGDYLTFRYLDL